VSTQRLHAQAHVLMRIACALHAFSKRVSGVQGSVVQAFAGANKCTVMARVEGHEEHDPIIRPGQAALKKVAIVASRSVCVGDSFTVLQVGTLGEVGSGHRQSAVLVLVRAAHEQSRARCEVFTAEQMRPSLGMVEWRRCGLPAMDATKVSVSKAPPLSECFMIHVVSYMLL